MADTRTRDVHFKRTRRNQASGSSLTLRTRRGGALSGVARLYTAIALLRDLGLDELGQEGEGFLPAEVAGFGGDDVGDAFLGDGDVGADGDFPEGDGDEHLAGEVGVVEGIGVADALVGDEFVVG